MKKICFILYDVKKSLGFEWLSKGLLEKGIGVYFILVNSESSEFEIFLKQNKIFVERIEFRKSNTFFFFLKLGMALKRIKPDVVHTHLRYADIFGQAAAVICGIKRRITTRHSSTFNHVYHSKSVLLDRFVNWLATDIVSISKVTNDVLINMEHVSPRKITLIHHGFSIESFSNVSFQRITNIQNKYNIPKNKIIIGVVSRYTQWKGYDYIIPALGTIAKEHEKVHFVFANANGDYSNQIKKMSSEKIPNGCLTEVAFESDIQALYKLFDIFIHVPVDSNIEAFGQTYVEALAAGVPSIFTLSGVAKEFIIHNYNALVVDFKNIVEIKNSVTRLINNTEFRKELSSNGLKSLSMFTLDRFVDSHANLYFKN